MQQKTALLVIDVQRDYCAPDGAMAQLGKDLSFVEPTIENINSVIQYCRDHDIMVFFIKTMHSEHTDSPNWVKRSNNRKSSTGICRTEHGQQFYNVHPISSDPIIIKHRYSAFIGTNLDFVLRAQGITRLLCCGFMANICVESTVRDGFMMGYDTITLSDCMGCYEEEGYRSAIYNIERYFGSIATSDDLLSGGVL